MRGNELAKQAFADLFPDRDQDRYRFSITHSGRFSSFNANVRKQGDIITFGLSKEWKKVGDDITMGLLQELMLKLFKKKGETESMRLYHIFIKKVHVAAPKTGADPNLLNSFDRVNDTHFSGMIEQPNLRFGRPASTTMGSYNYHTDTITINPNLRGKDELIDYVMYHELLHKRLKFTSKNGRTTHHTREFRIREKSYPESARIERELSIFARKAKLKNFFKW